MTAETSSVKKPLATFIPNPEKPTQEALEKMKKTYAGRIFEYLTPEQLYALPEYFLNRNDEYNEFPFSDIKFNAVRGTMPCGRVFIAVRYIDETDPTSIKTDTCFQRYTDEIYNWAIASGCTYSYIHHTGGMSSDDFQYLAKLVKGEPCGIRRSGREDHLKSFVGVSIVHLGTKPKLQVMVNET